MRRGSARRPGPPSPLSRSPRSPVWQRCLNRAACLAKPQELLPGSLPSAATAGPNPANASFAVARTSPRRSLHGCPLGQPSQSGYESFRRPPESERQARQTGHHRRRQKADRTGKHHPRQKLSGAPRGKFITRLLHPWQETGFRRVDIIPQSGPRPSNRR